MDDKTVKKFKKHFGNLESFSDYCKEMSDNHVILVSGRHCLFNYLQLVKTYAEDTSEKDSPATEYLTPGRPISTALEKHVRGVISGDNYAAKEVFLSLFRYYTLGRYSDPFLKFDSGLKAERVFVTDAEGNDISVDCIYGNTMIYVWVIAALCQTNSTVCLEFFENSLHYEYFPTLFDIIFTVSKIRSAKVICTTYSMEVIRAFWRVLVSEKQGSGSFITFRKDRESGLQVPECYSESQLGYTLNTTVGVPWLRGESLEMMGNVKIAYILKK